MAVPPHGDTLEKKLSAGAESDDWLALPDDVEEHALVVESEVAQVVGEPAKIVAHAYLEVVANGELVIWEAIDGEWELPE